MTVRTQLLNGQSGLDYRDTINAILPKLASVFLPATGTGNDATAIQAAHDAASAAGAGIVWLGNLTWSVASLIELDADKVAFQGHNAIVNFTGTRDVGLHVYSSNPTPGGTASLECSGVAFLFASTINRGVYFQQGTNPQQQNAAKNWSNCRFEGATHTLEWADNAYIMTFRNCSIGNSGQNCVYRENSNNNSERIGFVGCTFYNSPRFLNIIGVSSDWYFTLCSFDYCSEHFMLLQSGDYTFLGCHFEAAPSGTPFEYDNSAIATYVGCFFGMTVATTNMFVIYGNRAQVTIRDCFQGLSATGPVFSDGLNFVVSNFTPGSTGQWDKLATNGTVTPNALDCNDWFITLDGNWNLSSILNGTRGTRVSFHLKAGATARTITYGSTLKGATVTSIPANGVLVITALYDGRDSVWDLTTTLRSA